ncbi:hypothetical protein OVY29_23690 [Sphingopyxis sp. SE2]|uniref:hypothetical protein n=1 Tax=Sphingomonadales TaxID=204457 RepID=UPI002491F2D1|nr:MULTISPECIES: hypothetical protein [Sphingomonadaceae]MDT7531661.1 hypothetical protein [Sphingopyxis sp. SE2]
MSDALILETGDLAMGASFLETRPHLFSDVAVFINASQLAGMRRIIAAIETVARHPDYLAATMDWAPPSARQDFGPHGVFMGYDFHLSERGPALIEINTNAGGAMLNAVLARAQRVCCPSESTDFLGADSFEAVVAAMFSKEWRYQRGSGEPVSIAIVDDDPVSQYLFPEFLLTRHMLERAGHSVCIADPSEFDYASGTLRYGDRNVDLIYNRLVDFSLDRPEHSALRAAYLDGSVVVTPNPHVHAKFADKRNLTLLSDTALLREWGFDQAIVDTLDTGIPATERVDEASAKRLWAGRRQFFFKPAGGYGSKAAYRGDKLTKSVWAEILESDYVAQAYVRPSERTIRLDGEMVKRKIDVRLYTYDGEPLVAAARLYQGQTTNMRTAGGGFAPVLLTGGGDPSQDCDRCATGEA